MDIDLSFLKFHNFSYDKKYNNLWSKDIDKLKNEIILKKTKSFVYYVSNFRNWNELLNDLKRKKHFHDISSNKRIIVFEKIIKNCHKNLYKDLDQIMECYENVEKIPLYQYPLTNRVRLLFIFHNVNNKELIIPIIFDLKHCFYETKKNFDNNSKHENFTWDFKAEQKNIKEKIKDNKV